MYNPYNELKLTLSDFGWFTLSEIKKMNKEDKLIGRDSPTGTYAQLILASKEK